MAGAPLFSAKSTSFSKLQDILSLTLLMPLVGNLTLNPLPVQKDANCVFIGWLPNPGSIAGP